MNQNLESLYLRKLKEFQDLQTNYSNVQSSLLTTQRQMDSILHEQDLLERSTDTLSAVKPLLSASSIDQCISLANTALSSIFNSPYTCIWDPESQRFLLHSPDGFDIDLAEAGGGGLATTISFVFTVYLLNKLGRRKLMFFDEAFTQISTEFLPTFLEFARKLCADLHIDLCLITHDARIEDYMVDHHYHLEDGFLHKIK